MGERHAMRHPRNWRFTHDFDTQQFETSASEGKLTVRTTVAVTSSDESPERIMELLWLERVIFASTIFPVIYHSLIEI